MLSKWITIKHYSNIPTKLCIDFFPEKVALFIKLFRGVYKTRQIHKNYPPITQKWNQHLIAEIDQFEQLGHAIKNHNFYKSNSTERTWSFAGPSSRIYDIFFCSNSVSPTITSAPSATTCSIFSGRFMFLRSPLHQTLRVFLLCSICV